MGPVILSVWLMIAVLCLRSLCGQVAEWFRRQTNMGRPGFSNESMQFCVVVVLVVWWLSCSGDSQMCHLPVDDSSVVLMQFLWSGGRVVEATEKSGTCRLIRAVLCSCSFCGLVAYWLWRQTNLRLSVWLMIAVLR